ncbi:MAG: recombinase family protein [Candidatus Peribacter sp.]|nr:recombinase family protein [Candidatus Peribacter sp.]
MKDTRIEHRAVGYVRESTRSQTVQGYRADYQKDRIESYCRKNGIKLVKIFEDSGSGKDLRNRPNFQRMVDFAKANSSQFIVVEDITRFYREFKDGMNMEDKLFNESGIIVIDPEDYNPRELRESGISPQAWRQRAHRRVDAEGERRDIIQRVTQGYQKKKEGQMYVGPLPYAVEWIDPDFPKYIRYLKQEGKVVQEIFNLYLTGIGCTAIAKHLNEKGYFIEEGKRIELQRKSGAPYFKRITSNVPFTFDRIRSILGNKTYTGRQNTGNSLRLFTLDKNDEEVCIQPLIDDDTFSKVAEQLKINRRGKNVRNSRQTDRVYLFQGIVRHAECGCPMHGVPERLRNGEITRRYQCSASKQGTCNARLKSLRADEVESQIIELLKEIKIKSMERIESELRQIIKITAAELSKPQAFENLTLADRDELKSIKEALGNSYDWLLAEQKAIMEERVQKLEHKAKGKSVEMLRYYDFQELRRMFADLSQSFTELQNLAARQELISILFQKILIGKPLPKQPHEHTKAIHWMKGAVAEYEEHRDATKLKVLLRQFTPMLFQEIHVGKGDEDTPIKKVIFKPTGLFLLMTDGVRNAKKKS